jgi:hypothetical protein
MTKKIYFIFALFIFKVFALYSQNVFDNIYDLDISNKDIKKLILEIKNHLPEISDNENFIKTKKYELVIYYDEDGRYEAKADEASEEKKLHESIYYKDNKKNIDLFIRRYKYKDGRYILRFSYTEKNIKKEEIKYLWNDTIKKYELCD